MLYLDNRLQYDVSLTLGRSIDGDVQQEQIGSDPEKSYIMLVVTSSCELSLTSQAIYIYVQSIIPYKIIGRMHTNRYHPYEKLYNECMIGVEWKELSRM